MAKHLYKFIFLVILTFVLAQFLNFYKFANSPEILLSPSTDQGSNYIKIQSPQDGSTICPPYNFEVVAEKATQVKMMLNNIYYPLQKNNSGTWTKTLDQISSDATGLNNRSVTVNFIASFGTYSSPISASTTFIANQVCSSTNPPTSDIIQTPSSNTTPISETTNQKPKTTTPSKPTTQQSTASNPDITKPDTTKNEPIITRPESMKTEGQLNTIKIASSVEQPVKIEEVKNVDGHPTSEGTTSKHILFKGKAKPNSIVTLYIFSDPIVVTIKADKNGDWQYTLDKPLERGDHKAYIVIQDEKTQELIRSEVKSFTISKARAFSNLNDIEGSKSLILADPFESLFMRYIYYVLFLVALAIIFIFVFNAIKHKKTAHE